jgi:hypothetical protein
MFNNTNYSFLLHPRQCVESCRGLYGSGGYSGYNSQVKYLLPSQKCPYICTFGMRPEVWHFAKSDIRTDLS